VVILFRRLLGVIGVQHLQTAYGLMTRVVRLVVAVVASVALAEPSHAFDERWIGGGSDKPAAGASNMHLPSLDLAMPELSPGKDTGTEIRIPGVGSVGVLPQLDFGLELLYGANDSGGRPDDKSQPSDMQIRATIKHRF
jgi:hypothetical protein